MGHYRGGALSDLSAAHYKHQLKTARSQCRSLTMCSHLNMSQNGRNGK